MFCNNEVCHNYQKFVFNDTRARNYLACQSADTIPDETIDQFIYFLEQKMKSGKKDSDKQKEKKLAAILENAK